MKAVILKDGARIQTDMVVVGIGIRANTTLFDNQLIIEKGGIKVNGYMQTSHKSVYAVGDVASFPIQLFGGDIRRLEHVDSARKTARHAVASIMAPEKRRDLDYIPFFYSRVFTLSWQFYGENRGQVVHYGNFVSGRFGAYWVKKRRIVGAFLEGGTSEEYEAISTVIRFRSPIEDMAQLEMLGVEFALQIQMNQASQLSSHIVSQPMYAWHAFAGLAAATSIAAFAYWYGRRRRRW